MDVTFCGTACVSGVLKIAEFIIQKFKHIHARAGTHTHTHMHTPYAACKLFTTHKIGWYDKNVIHFALCY